MDIRPLPYDGEGLERFARSGPFVRLWEPDGLACVLGAGTPVRDIDLQLCAAAHVPVYRRRGGGGAVILSPGCLVVTACFDGSRKAFATQWVLPIAEAIAQAVEAVGLAGVRVRGLGDVAIGDRKILGSSLYANRKVALYQGSLLVESDLSLIPRYLPYPSKEPEYRRGRSHLDFVTSLAREGYRGGMAPLRSALERELGRV